MVKAEPRLMPIGVDEAGRLPLPWLAQPLAAAIALERSHALLAQGPAGVGHLEFGLVLAQAWLCESSAARPCGHCASCRLVRTRVHPDLLIMLPDALREALGWMSDEERARIDGKPSRDLRIQQVREAVDWSHNTSGRGRGKALLLHPADALNLAAANALLKTLEEPASGLRIVLTTLDAERLLPTLRSRCQRLRLELPPAAQAAQWLAAQGVSDARALLALSGGSPIEALALASEGFDAALIADLPRRVAAGDAGPLLGRALPRVIDLLIRLAHDLQATLAGGKPRFYVGAAWPARGEMSALVQWQRALLRAARHDDHPWNAPLLVQSLVTQAAAIWPRAAGASLHSGR